MRSIIYHMELWYVCCGGIQVALGKHGRAINPTAISWFSAGLMKMLRESSTSCIHVSKNIFPPKKSE